MTSPSAIAELIAAKQGIFLDVGCSDHKSPGSVGMDKRDLAGVDIVHDIEVLPWPVPESCAYRILMSHIVEHLTPWLVVDILNACWRVMKAGGQLLIATPYAGSPRFWQDPTHVHGWMEATPQYFDPACPLWQVYRPKPWTITTNQWESVGDMQIVLQKREDLPI